MLLKEINGRMGDGLDGDGLVEKMNLGETVLKDRSSKSTRLRG